MRGDVLGTWERCPECAEKERQLLDRIEFIKVSPPAGFPLAALTVHESCP